jgi:NitT/TauT family transport system permease protein
LFGLAPLFLLALVWQLGSSIAPAGTLPAPLAVMAVIGAEARSGALFVNLAATLARVAASFVLAMALGTALGVAMGRDKSIDRLCDPLLIVLLNLPALTLREGTRALDERLDDMARVFKLTLGTKVRHVVLPQLAPYFAAAMRSGLSLVWKIVLVVELLGRSNGVGFEIGIAFQLFDVTRLLAYALPFVGLVLAIETFVVQPVERHVSRWRPSHGA